MTYNFLHISDIHFQAGCADKRAPFRPFLLDLEKQLTSLSGQTYVIISGDVAQSADDVGGYEAFIELIDPVLTRCGVDRERRICVPGNHDVSRSAILGDRFGHDAVVDQLLAKGVDVFNSIESSIPPAISRKFGNYLAFQSRFAKYGITDSEVAGCGHSVDEILGVFCLNTALLSLAGLPDSKDKGRLACGTRAIANWLEGSRHPIRILVAHHPIEWLSGWAGDALKEYLPRFSLVLTGHEHRPEIVDVRRNGRPYTVLAAPALLTDSRTPMGYTIPSVRIDGSISVRCREWSDKGTFVVGARMSGADDGVLECNVVSAGSLGAAGTVASRHFSEGLKRTLKVLGHKDLLAWVEPQIYDLPEAARSREKAARFSVEDIVTSTDSFIITSPPQFGLSGLSWHLCKVASEPPHGRVWVRVDMEVTKPHDVRESIYSALATFGVEPSSLECVVLDGWAAVRGSPEKCIAAIRKAFPDVRLILMETQRLPALDSVQTQLGGGSFRHLYLWAQTRTGLREIVTHFRAVREIDADVEALLSRIIQDLQALNLPRTPLNCLTLLLVAPLSGDALVNRAEVIKRILAIVFDSDVSLTYASRADKTDCEHLLGAFAEFLVRGEKTAFGRQEFVARGRAYCKEMLIDVDVEAVLDLLIEQDIIVASGASLCFRFSYWVYYFAAARMHHSKEFRDYILADMQYTRFPEVIEFYTGIDRRRGDALESLAGDLSRLHEDVRKKAKIGPPSQLYALFKWDVETSDAEKMMQVIETEVLNSSLPQEIKDRFADRGYDPARPYDQEIKSLFTTYSFQNLSAGLRASARALRNSDYVSPDTKSKLFDSVMNCWEQVLSVLVLVSPLLAERGRAEFDGTQFILDDADEAGAVAVTKVWDMLPYNVISWFRDDLCSAKMGPLLFDRLGKEVDLLKQHNIALLICAIRPPRWRETVEAYVTSVPRDSFYLYNLGNFLIAEHRYAYLSVAERQAVAHAVKFVYAKKLIGSNRPSEKMIRDVSVSALNEFRGDD